MTRRGMDMRQDYIHLKWECEAMWLEWSPLRGRCLSAGSARQAGKGLRGQPPFNPRPPLQPAKPREKSAERGAAGTTCVRSFDSLSGTR